jgi:hypothetical protein
MTTLMRYYHAKQLVEKTIRTLGNKRYNNEAFDVVDVADWLHATRLNESYQFGFSDQLLQLMGKAWNHDAGSIASKHHESSDKFNALFSKGAME